MIRYLALLLIMFPCVMQCSAFNASKPIQLRLDGHDQRFNQHRDELEANRSSIARLQMAHQKFESDVRSYITQVNKNVPIVDENFKVHRKLIDDQAKEIKKQAEQIKKIEAEQAQIREQLKKQEELIAQNQATINGCVFVGCSAMAAITSYLVYTYKQ